MPVHFDYNNIAKRQRNLPHWTKDGVVYWITFRAGDSLPQEKLRKWCADREYWLASNPEPWADAQWEEYNRQFGARFHEWLDAGAGACVLEREDVRGAVCECLTRFDHDRYCLLSAVIMPNHVHMLLQIAHAHSLPMILKGMKGTSARRVNQMLGLTGAFWAAEAYDHIVRSEVQLHFLSKYIEANPIKAGLNPCQYWLKKIDSQ